MSREIIDNGSFLGDPTAETTRSGFAKVNANFDELYGQYTYTASVEQQAEHNRSKVMMSGSSLVYTIKNNSTIETGVPFIVIQNGTGFSFDVSEVNATFSASLDYADGSIFFVTKTGRKNDTDQYTITKSGSARYSRVENATVTGTYAIDWAAPNEVFVLTMTGDTTFSDINLPTGDGVKVIEIILSGNFTPTLPVTWEGEPNNNAYDGAVRNRLIVSCINGNSGSEDIIYTLSNLST